MGIFDVKKIPEPKIPLCLSLFTPLKCTRMRGPSDKQEKVGPGRKNSRHDLAGKENRRLKTQRLVFGDTSKMEIRHKKILETRMGPFFTK